MTNDYGNLELHQVLLAAMKDIDRICRENGLKYYLHAGTLLGAVNHKGFIPWDDDVDISMLPDDFRIFTGIIQSEYDDRYQIKTYDNTPDYYSKLNKLQVLGAEVVYVNGKKENVFIDISVLHHAPDGEIARWIQRRELEFWDRVIGVKSGSITPVSFLSKVLLIPFSHIHKSWIGRRLDKIMGRYDGVETQWYALMIHMLPNPYTGRNGYENDFVPKSICMKPKNIAFEDTQLMVYSNPVVDLERRYGKDFAKPYPEEKRVSKHNICQYIVSEQLHKRISMKGDES